MNSGRLRRSWTLLWLALLPGLLVSARADAAEQIHFRMIDGKLCAACTLHGPRKSIPANVVIDLGVRMPLLVHKNTARLLQIGGEVPGEIRFGDMVLSDLRAAAVDLPSLDELSKLRASELGEIPAVAIVGLPAFNKYILQLEIGEGNLNLLSPSENIQNQGPSVAVASDRVASFTYEEQAYGYWLTAVAPDDFKLRTRFMTSEYDTTIDAVAADLAGSAAGAIDDLHLGGINIARFVAFRPEDLSTLPEPKADLLIGTNLLACFKVTIDPAARRITFEQTKEPQFPTQERTYFQARTAGDAAGIEAFLSANPTSRLAGEAGRRLWSLRVGDEPGDTGAIKRAIEWLARTTVDNRRAMAMVTLADELVSGSRQDRHELARAALATGTAWAPADLNGVAAFHINGRLGLIALRLHDLKEARRRLLSAAFGLPRDASINLWLGELYEESGKLTRAWSRYVQSALERNPPPAAFAGLDRLNRNPKFRASFSMEDAEQLLEGRVPEFHPPERFADDRGADTAAAVRLVELFTCIDEATTMGPELAFDGLRQYLSGTPSAFVEYHLASPAADPLVSSAATARASFYQTTTAPAAFFDGQGPNLKGGTDKNLPEVYGEYLKAAKAAATATDWHLNATANLSGDTLACTIDLAGPAASEQLRVHVILCEQRVMIPGGNAIVLHRNVARALLSPDGGFVVEPSAGGRVFNFRASIGQITQALERQMGSLEDKLNAKFTMKPSLVDPREMMLAVFLQDQASREVKAARMVTVAVEKKGP